MSKSTTLRPEDIFSDDSSFYGGLLKDNERDPLHADSATGSEGEIEELTREAAEYSPETYWTHIHPHLLSTIQARRQEENKKPPAVAEEKNNEAAHSPMDIDTDTVYLPRNMSSEHETSANFLSRLPASSTREENIGSWIYAYPAKRVRDNEDRAGFMKKGLEALHAYVAQEAKLRYENDKKKGSAIALSRKVKPLQRELEKELLELARETNCISGKWMMFITPDRVDSYWAAVAGATMKGQLGIAAKVATQSDMDAQGKPRLIAVYTKDYEDIADIKRVLRKLVELDLVKREERPIYYKRDAWTYLEIMSGNKYGLKATAFSSADVLGGKV
ncbi:DUF1917 domain-containing protein [Aspergillus mulundensis]|uniref:DUF1917-domain-containing protein n=1 Tax=Aspergillus mulundensis TaxID=1810919 RepID=A0A3D8SK86_9EURO|nr:Uncharacterized protein DSM5745_03382 [Aspergillus mulundensis]RDW86740.1 Uncharacterized protein DSM5745_03382 [Aspergillus mulundensis]